MERNFKSEEVEEEPFALGEPFEPLKPLKMPVEVRLRLSNPLHVNPLLKSLMRPRTFDTYLKVVGESYPLQSMHKLSRTSAKSISSILRLVISVYEPGGWSASREKKLPTSSTMPHQICDRLQVNQEFSRKFNDAVKKIKERLLTSQLDD